MASFLLLADSWLLWLGKCRRLRKKTNSASVSLLVLMRNKIEVSIMNSATMVKRAEAKKPFEQRWNAAAPEAQDRLYRALCRKLLVAPNYSRTTPEQNFAILFMRTSKKPMANGKAHHMAEKLLAESLMSC